METGRIKSYKDADQKDYVNFKDLIPYKGVKFLILIHFVHLSIVTFLLHLS